jgi:hypothetical protein
MEEGQTLDHSGGSDPLILFGFAIRSVDWLCAISIYGADH